MTGFVMILSGPSGVGKDTVLDAWIAKDPRIVRVRSMSTRQPRVNEISGVDYDFISSDEFRQKIDEGCFLEYKLVHGNYYGTPLARLDEIVTAGKTAVLKIDVQGALTAMEELPHAISIFLLPPSFEVLESRLKGRESDSEDAMNQRLINAKTEIAMAEKYNYRLVNLNVQEVVGELMKIREAHCPTSS